MKKEMLYLCRVNGNNCYYVNLYEVADLGKAKAAGKRLMKKNGGDYRIYVCATIDGSIIEKGGYWEMTWANDWKYFNTPKYQDAYEGMEVEINLKTTTNIKGTIEFGKIIDAEDLVVELESGEVVYYKNNPWEKDNPDKRYFNFIADIYPVPERWKIEYEHNQYKDNHIFDRKSDTKYFTSYRAANQEYELEKLGYEIKVGRTGDKNEVVPAFPGFEYREWNDGVLLVETYKLTGCNQTYNRF